MEMVHSEKLQHLFHVAAFQPLDLGHGVTPFPARGPPPSIPAHAAWLATMGEYLGVITPGNFQGVGQHREMVEGTVIVDCAGQGGDVRGQPCQVDGDGTEGVAEDVS